MFGIFFKKKILHRKHIFLVYFGVIIFLKYKFKLVDSMFKGFCYESVIFIQVYY